MPRPPAEQQKVEQSIRVFTTFFAALVGFALKRLLDQPIDGARWASFVVGVCLFLRFISGSANHLWFEHALNRPSETPTFLFAVDVGFLTVYGLFGVFISYSPTSESFFLRSIVFLAIPILWVIVDVMLRLTANSIATWRFWLWNVLHLAAFIFALVLEHQHFGSVPLVGWSVPVPWLILLLVSPILLALDFWYQLVAMKLNEV